jgi:hypothetical protein
MLDRLDPKGDKRGRELPPVAWHGRFTTLTLAEPDLPTMAAPMPGPGSLDVYTAAPATTPMPEAVLVPDAPMPEPEPEPEPEVLAPPPPLLLAPAPPVSPPQPIHEELDPDVRALVDELYEQARAELSGEDVGFFAPVAEPPVAEPIDEPPVNELLIDEIVAEPPATAPAPAPRAEPDPEPRVAEPPGAPAAPNASSVERPGRARGGWVPAIQIAEWRQRPGG